MWLSSSCLCMKADTPVLVPTVVCSSIYACKHLNLGQLL